MKILPFRFREISKKTLITNEIGDYKIFDKGVVTNFFSNSITKTININFKNLMLYMMKIKYGKSHQFQTKLKKVRKNNSLNYIIAIPTLRCNFSCSYCQVSRASVNSKGYDWDERDFKKI